MMNLRIAKKKEKCIIHECCVSFSPVDVLLSSRWKGERERAKTREILAYVRQYRVEIIVIFILQPVHSDEPTAACLDPAYLTPT